MVLLFVFFLCANPWPCQAKKRDWQKLRKEVKNGSTLLPNAGAGWALSSRYAFGWRGRCWHFFSTRWAPYPGPFSILWGGAVVYLIYSLFSHAIFVVWLHVQGGGQVLALHQLRTWSRCCFVRKHALGWFEWHCALSPLLYNWNYTVCCFVLPFSRCYLCCYLCPPPCEYWTFGNVVRSNAVPHTFFM